jgi:hypothetical protein
LLIFLPGPIFFKVGSKLTVFESFVSWSLIYPIKKKENPFLVQDSGVLPSKTCKNYTFFEGSVQDYIDHFETLIFPRPDRCWQCTSQCPLIKHSIYKRQLKDVDRDYKNIPIQRFLCKACGRTVSFLPSFAVPYKHYSGQIIHNYLHEIILFFKSIHSVYQQHYIVGYSTALSWAQQFYGNCAALYHDGLRRLGIDKLSRAFDCHGSNSVASSLAHGIYRCFVDYVKGKATSASVKDNVFSIVQVPLTHWYPPLGLFRSSLTPLSH